MGNADKDLLVFVLRYGDVAELALREYAEKYGDARAKSAAGDVAWLLRVNRRDWTHEEHTDDCMDEWGEQRRDIMTPQTVEANHRLHMGHVERIAAAFRAQR